MRDTHSAQHQSGALDAATKDVYAWFGLAYYFSECLHKQLCSIHAFAGIDDVRDATRGRVEQRFKLAFRLPLGRLAELVAGELSPDLREELEKVVAARNHLAHYFWFERAEQLLTREGLRRVKRELEQLADRFRDLDDRLTELYEPRLVQLVGADVLEQSLSDVLKGRPWEPLPNKRFPNKVERLTRAWNVAVNAGGTTIVLMSEDGALWQIDFEGLTWSGFDTPGADWQEHEQIQKWLPAEVRASPELLENGAAVWALARGAKLRLRRDQETRRLLWHVSPGTGPTGER